ncbi:hypothetical protein [Streptomyces caelestis]|uniref:hypothetical protein n=1 Tax=Streptomyces caelestis TaxID=36816 RepID=UPI003653DAEF
MEEITASGEDDEDEQRTYSKILTAIGDYRRRHHRAGPDILGLRPAGLDGDEGDHLTDAIDLYAHARVPNRLEDLRTRTAAERTAVLPPTSPLHPHHRTTCPGPAHASRDADHMKRSRRSWFTGTRRAAHRTNGPVHRPAPATLGQKNAARPVSGYPIVDRHPSSSQNGRP